jgi:hypothetical protein
LNDKTVQTGSEVRMNDVHLGQVYRFSLPRLTNISHSPLAVTSAHITRIPNGVTLLGYPEFTVTAASGYPLNQRSDYPGKVPDPSPYSGPITIQPGETSPHFFMVAIRLKHNISEPLQECVIDYTQDQVSYSQPMSCQFALSS